MQSVWCRRVVLPVVLGFLLASAACNKEKNQLSQGPSGGPGGMPGGGGGPPSPIGQSMKKMQGLSKGVGRELTQSETLSWDTIQTQTKEYAQEAASLGKYDPPKGDKDSWAKLTASFASSAENLDKAATAKDKDATQAAQAVLNKSCMGCHSAHRGGPGGGMGRPGGRPGGPPRGNPQ